MSVALRLQHFGLPHDSDVNLAIKTAGLMPKRMARRASLSLNRIIQFLEQLDRVSRNCPADRDKLHNIDTPLATLIFGNK